MSTPTHNHINNISIFCGINKMSEANKTEVKRSPEKKCEETILVEFEFNQRLTGKDAENIYEKMMGSFPGVNEYHVSRRMISYDIPVSYTYRNIFKHLFGMQGASEEGIKSHMYCYGIFNTVGANPKLDDLIIDGFKEDLTANFRIVNQPTDRRTLWVLSCHPESSLGAYWK